MPKPKPIAEPARSARRAHAQTARGGDGAPVAGTGPHTLRTATVMWVSAGAIRTRLAAWGMGQGRAARGIMSDVGLRTAIGVAAAIVELEGDPAWARWGNSDSPVDAGASGVREDVAELARRSGFPAARVREALTALAGGGVVARTTMAGDTVVRVENDARVVAPRCAQVAWAHVRAVLVAHGVALPAPLAVLRALTSRVDAAEDEGSGDVSVRASVRDLADDTHFGRSAVTDAVAALEAARLLAVETRAGRVTRFTITPSSFGVAVGHADAGASAGRLTMLQPDPEHASAVVFRQRDMPRAAVSDHAWSALIGTFGETEIRAPRGTPLTLEQDDVGRWYCRVGPHLRLGPLDP